MSDFRVHGNAMSKEDYDRKERAGEITRPLTWGPQQRHNTQGELAASPVTPFGSSTGGQTPPAPAAP